MDPTTELFKLFNIWKYTEATLEKAKELINAGADANFGQSAYPRETMLYRLLQNGTDGPLLLQMVKLLIDHGADVNKPADFVYPLTIAAQRNQCLVCRFLLEAGANEGLDNALAAAIEKDSIDIVKLLIEKGVDLERHKNFRKSFLTFCNEAYRLRDKNTDALPGLEMARFLLDHGVDPNPGDDDFCSPLEEACRHGFHELVELLLDRGATLAPSAGKNNPIIFYANDKKLIKFLLKRGADLNACNHHGMNRLASAVQQGEDSLVPFLIKLGIDLYAVDKSGYTALHHAVLGESKKKIKLLLPYYDLQKCDQISPLKELSKKPAIRELLGLPPEEKGEVIDEDKLFDFCKDDSLFLELKAKTEHLYEKITQKNIMIDSYLMPWDALLSETVPQLYENLKETVPHWKGDALQAVYFEYAGPVTDPFDAAALTWGYSRCDDSIKAGGMVFSEAGCIDFSSIFEGIEELDEHFDSLYAEIHEYLHLVASMHLHIAFSHFVNHDAFRALPIVRPFYLFGNEHDGDPVLVYKMS